MIPLSRSGRQTTALALAVLAFALTGCEPHACNTIGCTDGLEIAFEANTSSAAAQGNLLDITIETKSAGEFPRVMTCSFETTTRQLLCSSPYVHTVDSNRVHFSTTDLKTLRVTVSANGNQLSQEIFTPAYTAEEVWGPGCGVCTQATLHVALPS